MLTSSTQLSEIRINLVCICLTMIVYGVNIVLFGFCIYVLFRRHDTAHKSGHQIMFWSSVLSFALATSHATLTILGTLSAFANPTANTPSDRLDIESDIFGGSGVRTAGIVIYLVNIFAQDTLLTWRFCVVWSHSKIYLAPIMLQVGECSKSLMDVENFARPNADPQAYKIELYATIGWAIHSVLQVCATGGISYRLWKVGRKSAASGSRYRYKGTITMIIESGCLSALFAIILLVCLLMGDVDGLLAMNVSAQLATTIPLSIIVRVSFGLTYGAKQAIASYPDSTPIVFPSLSPLDDAHVPTVSDSLPETEIHLAITVSVSSTLHGERERSIDQLSYE